MAATARRRAPSGSLPAGLYVHVPFCTRRCGYCDFATGPYSAVQADRYLEALDGELVCCAARELPVPWRPRTVFIGGGTPTALSPRQLARLFELLQRRVDLGALEEWTLEANPESLDEERLGLARGAGVTRVSVGVQSFHGPTLAFLGRLHDGPAAERAVGRVMGAGLQASLDLIYGVPGQSPEVWEQDLGRALALDPGHLSAYCLGWEEGTPLSAQRARGAVAPVAEELEEGLYRRTLERLEGEGYRRYEISNFARPGRACRHNLTYWRNDEWLGVGNGAHSHLGGERRGNLRPVGDYIGRVLAGGDPAAFRERLGPRERAGEQLVLGLRLRAGVQAAGFRAATGLGLFETFREPIERFRSLGMLAWDGECLRLEERALFVSDAVFAELL